MLKFSTVNLSCYLSIFIFGTAAGYLLGERDIIKPEAAPRVVAATTHCPTVTPICPTVSTLQTLDPSPSAPQGLSELHSAQGLKNSETPEAIITDFDNPDEQIQFVLVEEPGAFTQMGEQIEENPDPLAPLFLLGEDQQLGYIQKLVDSQEDSAVVALNDLILSDSPPIQTAAIDGLISLLEMRTGHFELIRENLEQNAVFLNGEQLRKLNNAKQIVATP